MGVLHPALPQGIDEGMDPSVSRHSETSIGDDLENKGTGVAIRSNKCFDEGRQRSLDFVLCCAFKVSHKALLLAQRRVQDFLRCQQVLPDSATTAEGGVIQRMHSELSEKDSKP